MNIKRIYYLMGMAAIAAIMTAGPVGAQEQDSDTTVEIPEFIQRFDQDGDGLVSLAEFPTAEQRFDRLDANGDDYIDATEVARRPQRGKRRIGKMIVRFDADSDGNLSKEEFPGPDDHFARLDTDADGFLSKQEMVDGHRGSGPGRDDADGDGRISREEFSGPAEVFDRLDANGDDYIDRGEGRQGRPGKRQSDPPEEDRQ